MRLRSLVVGVLFCAAASLLPTVAMASVAAPRKLIGISDSQMKWTSCGKSCVQGIDLVDSISATIHGNTLVLGEELSHSDSKTILEENSVLLSRAVGGYGGVIALAWAAREMKVWVSSSAPFQTSEKFNGNTFTFGGWAGDGSLALTVVFG